jgi:hypothetical protein
MPKCDSSGGRTILPSGTTDQRATARHMTMLRHERVIVCAPWVRSHTWTQVRGREERRLPMKSEEEYGWTEASSLMAQGHLHENL